jgi:glycerol-3-phosphate dehydrogenase (NAD(P)+)
VWQIRLSNRVAIVGKSSKDHDVSARDVRVPDQADSKPVIRTRIRMGSPFMPPTRRYSACVSLHATAHERVAIIGDGQMALVLADVLAAGGTPTMLISPFESAAHDLSQTRTSQRLPGFRLASSVIVTADPGLSRDCTLLVCAIPTQYIRSTFNRMREALPAAAPVVSVAKGIEEDTFRLPCDVLREVLGADRPVAALSGPTIAAELARRLPALLVAASEEAQLAARVAAVFTSDWTRIYRSEDLIGVEVAGACKNVIAIAAGVADGMELGVNTKSALLARGLAEIARVGVALGGRAETFFGIAGLGDLATTCFAKEGRNRSFGERLARGHGVDQALAQTNSVVEGVPTAHALMQLARSRGLDLPICEAVEAMVFRARSPKDALAQLMRRDATTERIGAL